MQHYTVGSCGSRGRALWIQPIYYTCKWCGKIMINVRVSTISIYCSIQSKLLIVLEVVNEWVRHLTDDNKPFCSLWKQPSLNGAVSVHFYCTWTVIHCEQSKMDGTLIIRQRAHRPPRPCSVFFSSKPSLSTRQSYQTAPLKPKTMLHYFPSVHLMYNRSSSVSWYIAPISILPLFFQL